MSATLTPLPPLAPLAPLAGAGPTHSLSDLTGTHTYQDVKFDSTISHQCGVTLSDSVEARVIAEVMAAKPGIRVTYMPAMIRIDGEDRVVFDMRELGDALGKPITPQAFEVHTSTHYGRMVMLDDETVVVFGDMNDVLEFI